MSTLADFKPEQMAEWRQQPITRALMGDMKVTLDALTVTAAELAGRESPEWAIRVHGGIVQGWKRAVSFVGGT